MSNPLNKIAIISNSLGRGGAERFASVLSFILQDLGYEIHHILINDEIDYDYAGVVFNMGKLCQENRSIVKKIRKGVLLHRYLKAESIGIVIDNRTKNSLIREIITKMIYSRLRVFYIMHSYHLDYYLPKSSFWGWWIGKDLEKVICVSKSIEAKVQKVYHLKNTRTIHNPMEQLLVSTGNSESMPSKFILFFGRIDDKVKNFHLLLESYAVSEINKKGYQLIIMGDGDDVKLVSQYIKKLELSSAVIQIPFQKNPFEWVKEAKYTVLTSRFEGFPMSIIESLSLDTPVISVDCESGPSEILVSEQNGLLVENYNVSILASAMKRMIDDTDLYANCKKNARQSIAHLSRETIAKQWSKVLTVK